MDLRLGRWEQVLADVEEVDSLITDAPFDARTHKGTRSTKDIEDTSGISFPPWTAKDVGAFVSSWAPRTRRWICAMTSHCLIEAWEKAYRKAGLFSFAPVPIVLSGMGVRMLGDGPSSWTIYLMVARSKLRRSMANPASNGKALWRTTRGAYVGPADTANASGGRGKPMWLLRDLVEDYSNVGDLVCDPLAGWGTTLAAGLGAGRRVVGAESDATAHQTALERLGLAVPAHEQQLSLFVGGSL